MIPRKLHFIWVGDESKRPDNCIDTWKRKHGTEWEIKVWGNDDLARPSGWKLGRHMAEMSKRELNGVADIMRWEILHEYGGIVIDADSTCELALPEFMLFNEAFACWENEMVRPGLIAAGYVGSVPGNPFMMTLLKTIHDIPPEELLDRGMAWQTVGPLLLTEMYRACRYWPLHIFPSYYFIPEHFSGVKYQGSGPVYAKQMWGSTKRSYDSLYLRKDI